MKRLFAVAVYAAALAVACTAHAQNDIQWKQMLNVPKGANLPTGTSVDILGIQPGDTYEEARAKLEKLIAEPGEYAGKPRIREYRTEIYLPRPGGQRVTVSYVGALKAEFTRRGTGAWNSESIDVGFSAPSSGHQVVAVERSLDYNSQADQPRISTVLEGLAAKLGNRYAVGGTRSTKDYQFRFDDGRAVDITEPYPWRCGPVGAHSNINERGLSEINPGGACDVVFDIQFNYGISNDHASAIWFKLGDNERARQDFAADYQFFRDYVKNLQDTAGGAAPKL